MSETDSTRFISKTGAASLAEPVVIGDATLYCGDCAGALASMALFDTVITSPPYNCGMNYGTASDALPLEQYKQLLRDTVFSANARRICLNVGNYIGSRENRVRTVDVLADVSQQWELADEIIWDKGPANGAAWGNYPNSPRIRAQHENIYVYGELNLGGSNGLTWGEWSAMTTSIWRIMPKGDPNIHPAQMPVEVAERLTALYSPVGGLVVDPFMGSGTTGIAAVRRGRRFVGYEIDPAHFTTACKRIEQAYAQRSLFDAQDRPAPEQLGLEAA
jgi:DNA modification methylase